MADIIDDQGNFNHVQFNAYGQPRNGAGSTPYGFSGQYGGYTDSETGFVLMTHRYYDPVTGRFLTRDPIGYEGGINLYAYCYDNPVNYADPEGWYTTYHEGGEEYHVFFSPSGHVGWLRIWRNRQLVGIVRAGNNPDRVHHGFPIPIGRFYPNREKNHHGHSYFRDTKAMKRTIFQLNIPGHEKIYIHAGKHDTTYKVDTSTLACIRVTMNGMHYLQRTLDNHTWFIQTQNDSWNPPKNGGDYDVIY